jgi:hypothetical protein
MQCHTSLRLRLNYQLRLLDFLEKRECIEFYGTVHILFPRQPLPLHPPPTATPSQLLYVPFTSQLSLRLDLLSSCLSLTLCLIRLPFRLVFHFLGFASGFAGSLFSLGFCLFGFQAGDFAGFGRCLFCVGWVVRWEMEDGGCVMG